MQIELWGATALPSLSLPERPAGYFLLIFSGLLLFVTLYYYRRDIRQLSARQWLITAGLAVLALATRQFLPITYLSEGQLPPLAAAQNPASIVAPLAFVPMLFAGAVLGPAAALAVGFVDGLGRALWQSHHILDPFHLAIVSCLAAILIQQNYSGRIYAVARRPFVAGPFGAALLVLFTGLTTYSYAALEAGDLAALDLAMSTSFAYIPGLLVESLVGGLLVWLVISNLPTPLRRRSLTSPPFSHSLNKRLLASFLLFSSVLSFLLIIIGFNLAVSVSTRNAVTQMAQDAGTVAGQIPTFLARRQSLLVQAADQELAPLDEGDDPIVALKRLSRSGDFFRRLILVNDSQDVSAYYPTDDQNVRLTNLEADAVARTLDNGAPFISPAQVADDVVYLISFIVPVNDEDGERRGALIGQVPNAGLGELVLGLQGTMGQGIGFIVDERDQVIGHPQTANLLKTWTPPPSDRPVIDTGQDLPGTAYRGFEGSINARELVYYQEGPLHPWTVVVRVPYEVVIRQGSQLAASLAGVLVVALVLFGSYLLALGRSVAQPLTQLARVSQEIAGGSLDVTIPAEGEDEIGRLSRSFRQMQTALKLRLDELSLLLAVGQDVSQTLDLNRGMPAILKGALRGTGATGARIVVYSPTGRQPLVYGEGPASNLMARFDRQVTAMVRERGELNLFDPVQVASTLAPGREPERIPSALLALPLTAHERIQGVFWITHRQAHRFDQSELSFLRTLAGQASVLVDNAQLYAAAEGGRRRLAAVLSSTSNAVVVTDQTDRILLINPAMARLLKLDESGAIGHKVRDVIRIQPLVAALVTGAAPVGNLELSSDDGRVFYGGASTVLNHEGQAIGRVAVFKDITYLREIDNLKSEFVATVSHDLRSPLTYMLGYATTLPLAGDLAPKQQEYLDKILVGIDQMTVLINDLLDLGRLEAGIDLVMGKVLLQEVVGSVAYELGQQAEENGNEIVVRVQESLPPIRGEITLIRQAILNLVRNAIKYAAGSGPITLTAHREEYEVVIGVQDLGPGLTEQDRARIFEKFYRVDSQGRSDGNFRGYGLGLALVKSIAERHGGRAWCESRVGQGSTFYLALPLGGP